MPLDDTGVTSDTLTVLRTAREWLSEPSRWCKVVLAEGASGERVNVFGDRVRRRCINGALMLGFFNNDKTAHDPYIEAVTIVEAVCKRRGWRCAAGFNDDVRTTHEDVLCVMDEAIFEEKKHLLLVG